MSYTLLTYLPVGSVMGSMGVTVAAPAIDDLRNMDACICACMYVCMHVCMHACMDTYGP